MFKLKVQSRYPRRNNILYLSIPRWFLFDLKFSFDSVMIVTILLPTSRPRLLPQVRAGVRDHGLVGVLQRLLLDARR